MKVRNALTLLLAILISSSIVPSSHAQVFLDGNELGSQDLTDHCEALRHEIQRLESQRLFCGPLTAWASSLYHVGTPEQILAYELCESEQKKLDGTISKLSVLLRLYC